MQNLSLIYVKRFFFLCLISFFTVQCMWATGYDIIPYPESLIPQKGTFTFNKKTVIICDTEQTEITKLAQQFTKQLELVSGFKPEIKNLGTTISDNVVIFEKGNETNLEAYQLSISPKAIRIKANAANGFFYGLQTLYQLLPVEIYGKQKVDEVKWTVSCVDITDAPRFVYRGLHLDVGRYFFPVEFIKKYIDAMSIHKFNTFHWHLTEDQGWRIEIKKYPKLTEISSIRDETLIGHSSVRFPQTFDGKPYGGFYTQAEAREIVAYAAERFVTIIPEIEMPGHAQAALASYPFLSCNNDSTIKVATKWGVFKDVFCPKDSTFQFLEDVLTEIMDIFPSKYIHIGGDECPKDRWKASAFCQELIKEKNLKDEKGLQSYFIHRIEKFLNANGRSIIGWAEILEGGLAPNATVMSWRGMSGGIAAAKAGHKVIMTPNAECYFDHYQGNPLTEPLAIGGYLPLNVVYGFEPIPAGLNPDYEKYILGSQANVWTEYMPNSKQVEYMVFPRLAAMSEVLWSTKQNRNWDKFRNRLKTQFKRYDQLNLNYSRVFFDVQFQPNLTADRKIELTLSTDNPDSDIRYTLNGKSFNYTSPIILQETSEIMATPFEKGESVGKTISRTYYMNKLTGLSYTKNYHSTWYYGSNTNALTDGIYGNTIINSQWIGFRKGDGAEVIVDLLTVQPIQRFSVGILNATGICALVPPAVKLYGSVDGINYNLLAEKELSKSASSTWEIYRPELTFPTTEVKFLKLVLENPGDCPADPSTIKNGGVIFLDEMEAW